MIRKLKLLMNSKRPLTDIWSYFLGNYRYKFYYDGNLSKRYALIDYLRKKMLREHIKEQIAFRITMMNADCYNQGSCVICGCETTKLQMADKTCDKPCYPPMMTKREWKEFKSGVHHYDSHNKLFWILNGEILKRTSYGITTIQNNRS